MKIAIYSQYQKNKSLQSFEVLLDVLLKKKTIVFVEKDGIATVKPVMVGNESGDKFIVAGGPLQSGDKVIVNNFFRIKPGSAVAIDKTINK